MIYPSQIPDPVIQLVAIQMIYLRFILGVFNKPLCYKPMDKGSLGMPVTA